MVFKVKQRAASNYFKKVIAKNTEGLAGKAEELGEVTVDKFGNTTKIQYNWPYDFFSLVELAQVETENTFVSSDDQINEEDN